MVGELEPVEVALGRAQQQEVEERQPEVHPWRQGSHLSFRISTATSRARALPLLPGTPCSAWCARHPTPQPAHRAPGARCCPPASSARGIARPHSQEDPQTTAEVTSRGAAEPTAQQEEGPPPKGQPSKPKLLPAPKPLRLPPPSQAIQVPRSALIMFATRPSQPVLQHSPSASRNLLLSHPQGT